MHEKVQNLGGGEGGGGMNVDDGVHIETMLEHLV
jgi:hypothetical protein